MSDRTIQVQVESPADPTARHTQQFEVSAGGVQYTVTDMTGESGGFPAVGPPTGEWGEYDGVTLVAEGGMGRVFRARNKRLNRIEAVKLIRPTAGDHRERYRFLFEAEAAAGLDHPHLIKVYGGGEVGGVPYFAMQWVDGGELTAHRATLAGRPRAVARLMGKVARAVQHAHQHGILHRDLKPSNVLMDARGEPYVSDFGLAKRTDDTLGFTHTGAVIGTPQYMAPEQARGEGGLTTAVDVYGLGGVLYYLLTGGPPFVGRHISDVVKRITTEPPPPPSALAPGVDPDLEAICLKCLEKDPADRYQTAAELADDLERCARGESVSVRPPGLGEWVRRELVKTPPAFPGYVWQVKWWFGAIILTFQLVVAVAAALDAPAWVVWLAYVATWAGAGGALWAYMAAKFTRLPVTEQHSVMIAVGMIVGHAALVASAVPWASSARDTLALYPAMFALTGVALFVVGATHWGLFYLFGVGVALLAPVAALCPPFAPVLLGVSLAAIMWYWAHRMRTCFLTAAD